MQICKKCILPGSYPGISFDSEGICNICRQQEREETRIPNRYFNTVEELNACLEKYRKYRDPESRYDILVPLSGGVDSSYALIRMVDTFKLRPLVYHNDHGYEDPVATDNARRLCRELEVDLILWQNEARFMKALWKHFNRSTYVGLSACYVCANILYLNALELADRFGIKLVVNGYTKGQMAMQHNKAYARELYTAMMEVVSNCGDREFYHRFTAKWKMLDKQITFQHREDLEKSVDPEKILVVPFFAFKFYQTDKEALKKACCERFDWQPLQTTYPARTTNCIMSYLNTYRDLKRMNYSVYTEEYATLVRNGEMSREQALEDLRFNPAPGLLERLANEVGLELELPQPGSGDQSPESLKRRKVIENHWFKTLSGHPPGITLPFLREGRAPVRAGRENPQTLRLELAQPVYESLQDLGNRSPLAIFILFLTGYSLLLHRYTRIRDLVIGTVTPAASGPAPPNIVFCRNRIVPGLRLKGLIDQVKGSVLDAFNFGEYALETLMGKFPGGEIGEFSSFCNAACIHEGLQAGDKTGAPGLRRFPLVAVLSPRETSSALVVEYDGDLYPEEGIRSFTRNLAWFFTDLRAKLPREVDTLEILCPEEKEMLLFSFSTGPGEQPDSRTVIRRFREEAAARPGNTAVVSSAEANRFITYSELRRQADGIAALLREKGVRPGSLVGILLEPGIRAITAILGVLTAGGAYLPMDDQLPENRILTILDDSRVSILLTQSREVEQYSFTALQGLWLKPLKPWRTSPRPQVKDFDSIPFPDRSLVDYQAYNRFLDDALVKNSMSIQSTRGCPYGCLYCHKVWPRTHVTRSAKNIFAEVKLYYEMGVRRFSFIDEIFNLNYRNSREFFQRIIDEGLDLQFFFPNGMRGDLLTPEYIDVMVKAGVTGLGLALETASPRLQKLIRKNLDVDKLKENIDYLCAHYPHVLLELFTMHGFPTETEEEAMMTLDFIKSIKWLHFPYIFLMIVWPDTEMEELALKQGISRKTILRSEDLAQHEFSGDVSFDKRFTHEYQADFIKNYFLSRERLLHVLPHQMKVLTEDDLVQKYRSYLPTPVEDFQGLLRFMKIERGELAGCRFREETEVAVPDLNIKLRNHFHRVEPEADACRILLLDISQSFSRESHQLNNLVEPPLGLMYLLTYLNRRLGSRIHGKIAKPLIDFNNFEELNALIEAFQPDMIGIRSLIFYKNFFHRTVARIRHWGFEQPLVAGGPYATGSYESVLQDRHIDLAVLGEGELTFTELVEQFIGNRNKLPGEEVLKRIPGLAFIPASQKSRAGAGCREIIFLDQWAGLRSRVPGVSPELNNVPDDPAYVIYTSGSSGIPRGVVVEHGNLSSYLQAFLGEFAVSSGDIVLQQASYSFDASVEELYPVLLRGGRLAVAAREQVRDPHLLEALIKTQQVTIVTCSPLLLNMINGMERLEGVRLWISGGDVLKREHVDKLIEAAVVYNTYGPTETTVCAAYHRCSPGTGTSVPIGRPIGSYRLYILDRHRQPLPIGVGGELYIAGAGVTRGYLNNPEQTSERFDHDLGDLLDYCDERNKTIPLPNREIKNYKLQNTNHKQIPNSKFQITNKEVSFGQIFNTCGEQFSEPEDGPKGHNRLGLPASPPGRRRQRIYNTGDVARWRWDGNIEFLGRSDQQVQVRGYRVELAEIEKHLSNHREVTAAVVVNRQDNRGDFVLSAYVVTREKVPASEFRTHLAAELPGYMIPAHFVQLEQFPYTPGGKIDRQALPEPETGAGAITFISEETLRKQFPAVPEANLPQPVSWSNGEPGSKAGCFRCVIIGDTTLPIRCGEILLQHGHSILGMISDDPRVKAWAQKQRIPAVDSGKAVILSFLKSLSFDYLMGIFNVNILPEEVLRLPRRYTINYHDGPLPAYAGMHVPSWAIINRESGHGITWHVVDRGIDTGAILEQAFFPLEPRETAFTLHMKCYDAAVEAFTRLIRQLSQGPIAPRQQNRDLRSYFPKFKRPAGTGLISFNREAAEIHALVRALTFGDYENPLGLPKIYLRGDFLLVTQAAQTVVDEKQDPGRVAAVSDGAIVVATAAGAVAMRNFLTIAGLALPLEKVVQTYGLATGSRIRDLDDETCRRIDAVNSRICRYEHRWVERLARLQPLRLFYRELSRQDRLREEGKSSLGCETVSLPAAMETLSAGEPAGDLIIALFAAFLRGFSPGQAFDTGYADAALRQEINGLDSLFAAVVPLRIDSTGTESFPEFYRALRKELKKTRKYGTYVRDIFARYPRLKTKAERRLNIGIFRVSVPGDMDLAGLDTSLLADQLTLVIPEQGEQVRLVYDRASIPGDVVSILSTEFAGFAAAVVENPSRPLGLLPPPKGEIYGRMDRRILSKGQILDPLVIEDCLLAYPAVKRAAVIAKHWQGQTCLYACLESGEVLMEQDLRRHLQAFNSRLPLSLRFLQLERLPLTEDNRVNLAVLETLALEDEPDVQFTPPLQEIEKELAALWAEVLNIKPDAIGIDADFFEIGGHSLRATMLISKIQKKMKVKIPLALLFKTSTLRGLSTYIKQARRDSLPEIRVVEKREYYALSSAQKRMFFAHQMKQGDISDNCPRTLLLEGSVDKDRFETIIRSLIQRHDALRTSFEIADGEPRQLIREKADFSIHRVESGWQEVDRLIGRLIRPFRLNRAPLLRVSLIDLPEEKHILFFDMHHILTDAFSMVILINEFFHLSHDSPLPPLRIQYKDFAAWHNHLLVSGAIKLQEDYWLEKFSGDLPVLKMPLDYPRPALQDFQGETMEFTFDSQLTEKINKTVNQYKVTLYMFLLSVYTVLLSKYCGQEDIIVGTPLAGRPHPDLENLMGFFVNTLAMRNFPAAGKRYGEFLAEVRQNVLEAFENQDFQFEELIRKVKVKRDLGRNQLFDTMFAVQNVDVNSRPLPRTRDSEAAGDLSMQMYKFEERITQFDIIIHASEAGKEIFFRLRYAVKLFKRETIENFVKHFKEIAARVVDNPRMKIEDIEMSSDISLVDTNAPALEFNFAL